MNVKFSITTFATQNNTTKMNTTKSIQSALISVFDKTGLEPIVKALHNNNVTILNVLTTNIQKTNFFEKGITTLFIEYLFKANVSVCK